MGRFARIGARLELRKLPVLERRGQPLTLDVRADEVGEFFDVVFLNGYKDGSDHLGWHSDDSEEMDDMRPIAIVTLGQAREIWFRERPITKLLGNGTISLDSGPPKRATNVTVTSQPEVEKLTLEHGSLCLMAAGMQDTHQHRIPKAAFQPCGPRISLTFRGLA
jgi:alkylated DNA repair dioxygenase AlkB